MSAREQALVSVIIPVHNAERYLQASVESVFAQTHGHWELLLVDDGSTDGSPVLARRYAEQHPGKVRFLQHPSNQNRGAAATRNVGIRHASGEYVAFLDADDLWLPQKLETQIVHLRAHPEAAWTYGPSEWWYSWTGAPADIARDFVQDLAVVPGTLVRPPTLLALFLRNGKAVPVPGAILLRRDAVERVAGFEDSFRSLYGDQAFYAKLTLQESALVTDDLHLRYRQHPDTITQSTKRSHGRFRLAFLTWLEGYLSAQGVTDGEVWTIVRDELWRRRHPLLSRYRARARRIGQRLSALTRGDYSALFQAWRDPQRNRPGDRAARGGPK